MQVFFFIFLSFLLCFSIFVFRSQHSIQFFQIVMNLCKLLIHLGIVIAPTPERRFLKAIFTHFHPLKNFFLYIICLSVLKVHISLGNNHLMDRISHRRKFLLIFRHHISFHHFFFMVKIKGIRFQLPPCLFHFF